MSHFYRYLRPLEYNFNRYAVQLSPKGGICFRCLAEDPEPGPAGFRLVTVSAAICHDDDLFNQDVARTIADNRAMHGSIYAFHTPSLATNVIALGLVTLSENVIRDEPNPREIYHNMELAHLARRIKQVRHTHKIAWQLDKMGREVIEALDLKNYYARMQHR